MSAFSISPEANSSPGFRSTYLFFLSLCPFIPPFLTQLSRFLPPLPPSLPLPLIVFSSTPSSPPSLYLPYFFHLIWMKFAGPVSLLPICSSTKTDRLWESTAYKHHDRATEAILISGVHCIYSINFRISKAYCTLVCIVEHEVLAETGFPWSEVALKRSEWLI